MKRSVILVLCIVLKIAAYSQPLTQKKFYDSAFNETDSAHAMCIEIITYADKTKKAAEKKGGMPMVRSNQNPLIQIYPRESSMVLHAPITAMAS